MSQKWTKIVARVINGLLVRIIRAGPSILKVGLGGVFLRMTAIRFDGLWGLPGPDRGIVAGATPPRTPRSTFGRQKGNRKTAKTQGFGFLFLISL